VRSGGVIVADDTLFYVNPNVRKNLGHYTDEYNKLVFANKQLYSVILPVGHGITVSLKL
jgi:predicted O-methyltransferase YrrM